LVLDNVKIHCGHELPELLDHFGVWLEFLPPYSPDLNLIEEAFSKIKHFIHQHHNYYSATTGDRILFDMLEVLDVVIFNDAAGYFAHARYF
jgi:transposase